MIMKKLITALLALVLVVSMVGCASSGTAPAAPQSAAPAESTADAAPAPAADGAAKDTLNIGVLVWKFDDTYGSSVRSAMTKYAEELGAQMGVKVNLDMQNGNDDQAIQNDQAVVLLEKDLDCLVINLCDTSAGQSIVDQAVAKGIPIVFYNKEPNDPALVTNAKSIFIGTRAEEAGKMQGEILKSLWDASPAYDRNSDGKVQYLQFKGDPNNIEAIARTEYSVKQAEASGLVMDQVNGEDLVANWDTVKAQDAMTAVWANYGEKVEAVFCNNDDMALGVIAALNQVGYNMGDGGDKFIPIVGVDATDAAMESIKAGKLAATVKQDGDAMGKAIIQTALNGCTGKDWLEGTGYTLDADGFSARIPYAKITE